MPFYLVKDEQGQQVKINFSLIDFQYFATENLKYSVGVKYKVNIWTDG